MESTDSITNSPSTDALRTTVRIFRFILVALAVSVMGYSVSRAWIGQVDFPQYYAAATLFADGRPSDAYRPAEIGKVEHQFFQGMPKEEALFCYPPYAMNILVPLSMVSPEVAMYCWTALTFVCFAVCLFLLQKYFSLSGAGLSWMLVAIGFSGPMCQSIQMGQPTFFLLSGICGTLVALKQERTYLAGIALAMLLPKPHFALPMLAYLFGAGRWRTLFTFGGLGLALFAISIATSGPSVYVSYLEFMKWTAANPTVMKLAGCVTLRSQLLRLLPEFSPACNIVALIVFVSCLLGIAFMGFRLRRSPNFLDMLLLVAIPAGLLTTLYFQPYDLFLLLPSILAFCLMSRDVRMPKNLTLFACACSLLFFFPFYAYFYFAKWTVNPFVIAFAVFVSCLLISARRLISIQESVSGNSSI